MYKISSNVWKGLAITKVGHAVIEKTLSPPSSIRGNDLHYMKLFF
jgi:hypothetical protein